MTKTMNTMKNLFGLLLLAGGLSCSSNSNRPDDDLPSEAFLLVRGDVSLTATHINAFGASLPGGAGFVASIVGKGESTFPSLNIDIHPFNNETGSHTFTKGSNGHIAINVAANTDGYYTTDEIGAGGTVTITKVYKRGVYSLLAGTFEATLVNPNNDEDIIRISGEFQDTAYPDY
ncbi:hypothetical protein GCM10007415_13220 [Parapedobacter pyrenivorans]|uniref:DUF4251 domain-containing protein n=2 Tax=Parapedobacter pyrenivorans TaxID=1305674 RepID=A0A917HKS0_9SPHI|nr:hypothetical protein GCM10007415_13220 [Parapedobacter pyrenivorans]